MSTIDQRGYGVGARFFHWATVLVLAGQYGIGWTMPDVHRDTHPVGIIAWHLGVGTAVLLLVIVRLLWRGTHSAPPEPTTLPPILGLVARVTHWILYGLLLVLPLLGWANASSRGWTVNLLGVIALPPLSTNGSSLGDAMGDWHQVCAWILLALIATHVLAALFHHFILRDSTLRRMLPARR
jgi:cytochrome b561